MPAASVCSWCVQEAQQAVLARSKAHFARRKEEINSALLNAGEGGVRKQRRRFFSQEIEQEEDEQEEDEEEEEEEEEEGEEETL
jgi:hypothetical protein